MMSPPDSPWRPGREQIDRAFSWLSPAQRQELSGLLSLRRLTPGEQLFAIGDPADTLYVLVEGRVAVKKQTGWGRNSQVIALLSPPAPIGEASLVGAAQRKTTVEAVEETLLLCLPGDSLRLLAADQPALALTLVNYLLRITCLRLEQCSSRLARIL
ncbi:Crp/Fnr family transcriptional regulator [Desulfofustis limnaeus]|jgi:CRP-like cAMP-binding protein|nr:cyclic nucleotide-binding domain-containing protein [Desulfofustis limnaeus]MDX9895659.1 cyclic nucleotide-binding domain-containing protein [Desulfofustis sp.]